MSATYDELNRNLEAYIAGANAAATDHKHHLLPWQYGDRQFHDSLIAHTKCADCNAVVVVVYRDGAIRWDVATATQMRCLNPGGSSE